MGLLSLMGRISLDASDWDAKVRGLKTGVAGIKSQLNQFVTVSAIAFQAKKLIDYASNIQDMSERTGVGVETLQALDFALKQSGSSAEAAQKAFIKLGEARRKALADPGSKEAKQFKTFGIDQSELANLKDSGELFIRLSDSIQDVAVDSNSIPIVLDLIGRKNIEVLPAMASGLRKAAEEAKELNLIMEQDTIESLDDVGDQIAVMVAAIRKPFAEVLKFFLVGLDSIQIGIKTIAAAAVNAYTKVRSLNPLTSKQEKEKLKIFNESVQEELKAQIDAFVNRQDPEVIAEKRAEKRKREERKRGLGLDELLVADDPALKKESTSKGRGIVSDSLTQIGNFLGQSTNTPQMQQLSEQTKVLKKIEQNTGKRIGIDFPL